MIAIQFQDTIEGRRLAQEGRARSLWAGKLIVELVKEIYASHIPAYRALDMALEAGVIRSWEHSDGMEWLAHAPQK